MGLNNKSLLVLRQETAGFCDKGEATGYLKTEWLPSGCRLAFGSKSLLPPTKGEYICALYLNGQIFNLGNIKVMPEAAFAKFNLKLPAIGGEDVLAAGIFYKENGFLYPVIMGHKGTGSAWHKDFLNKLCHNTKTREGQNYQRWSYTAVDGEETSSLQDTVQFKPNPSERVTEQQNTAPFHFSPLPEEEVIPQPTLNTDGEKNENNLSDLGGEYFYGQNREHFERLMEDNTQLDELCDMIPGSKWVKVEYTEGEEQGYYIVGIIYDEEDKPMHICYGVPGQFALAPPDNLAKYCEWLPASIKEPQSEGYWVIYQSAQTGETYGEEG